MAAPMSAWPHHPIITTLPSLPPPSISTPSSPPLSFPTFISQHPALLRAHCTIFYMLYLIWDSGPLSWHGYQKFFYLKDRKLRLRVEKVYTKITQLTGVALHSGVDHNTPQIDKAFSMCAMPSRGPHLVTVYLTVNYFRSMLRTVAQSVGFYSERHLGNGS